MLGYVQDYLRVPEALRAGVARRGRKEVLLGKLSVRPREAGLNYRSGDQPRLHRKRYNK